MISVKQFFKSKYQIRQKGVELYGVVVPPNNSKPWWKFWEKRSG